MLFFQQQQGSRSGKPGLSAIINLKVTPTGSAGVLSEEICILLAYNLKPFSGSIELDGRLKSIRSNV